MAPLVLILFFQRQIVSGLTAGAVKVTRHGRQALLAPFRAALGPVTRVPFRMRLVVSSPHATMRLGYPFDHVFGPEALWKRFMDRCCARSLIRACRFHRHGRPALGEGNSGDWVGLGGNCWNLGGTWLGIPATGRPIFMRYHEYLRGKDGLIVEMEALWIYRS